MLRNHGHFNEHFLLLFQSRYAGLMPPNPKCIVCSSKPEVVIKVDTKRVTIKQFRDEILIKTLNMVDPDVIVDAKGIIIISSEEGETECNNEKLLSDMGIVDGCILKVDDFFQNYELGVVILHKDVDREGNLFDIIADPSTLKPDTASIADEAASSSENTEVSEAKKRRLQTTNDDDDDFCFIEDNDDEGNERPSTSSLSPKKSGNGSIATAPSTTADVSSSMDIDDNVCITLDDNDSDDQSKPSSTNLDTTPKKRRIEIDNGEPVPKRSKTDDASDEILTLDDD